MVNLSDTIYTDEDAAREHLERLQWPGGPVCPHCGAFENITKLEGESTRPGVYKCNACRKPFSVTVGTLFERSHIPLTKWLLAVHLLTASKKGMSAHQLHRMLNVSYKTAWFMSHRIREAMKPGKPEPLGGEGKTVEADETYIGGKEKWKHRKRRTSAVGGQGKQAVVALVERKGRVHSHHVPEVSGRTLRPILFAQISRKSELMTDEGGQYHRAGKAFARHETINHALEEYVRGDAHVNSVEGYFSILKRGITGVYHHVSQQHLRRYLAEFDFRFSNRAALGIDDATRAQEALKGIAGKRLTYRRSDQAPHG